MADGPARKPARRADGARKTYVPLQDMMGTVLEGLDDKAIARLLRDLASIKDNLRTAIARNATQPEAANA